MPSSRSTSLKFPRALMNVSRKSSCSGVSPWKRPRANEPSRRVPQDAHSRRATLSVSAQMGHRAITGFAMDPRCAPDSSKVKPNSVICSRGCENLRFAAGGGLNLRYPEPRAPVLDGLAVLDPEDVDRLSLKAPPAACAGPT